MFQTVRSMSPTQVEDLVGRRGDGGRLVREPQAADAGPAPLRADHDAIPLVDDPLRALGRLDMELRILRQLGERRVIALDGCAM